MIINTVQIVFLEYVAFNAKFEFNHINKKNTLPSSFDSHPIHTTQNCESVSLKGRISLLCPTHYFVQQYTVSSKIQCPSTLALDIHLFNFPLWTSCTVPYHAVLRVALQFNFPLWTCVQCCIRLCSG